jgi:hypothetical protein
MLTQQVRIERVDAIGKGYIPTKQLTPGDSRLIWHYRKRLTRFRQEPPALSY